MINHFFTRRKTCRFQGCVKSNGLTVCKKDGSLRHADKCNERNCKRWNRTPFKAFLWWWRFAPVFCTWEKHKEYWNRRWRE